MNVKYPFQRLQHSVPPRTTRYITNKESDDANNIKVPIILQSPTCVRGRICFHVCTIPYHTWYGQHCTQQQKLYDEIRELQPFLPIFSLTRHTKCIPTAFLFRNIRILSFSQICLLPCDLHT